MSRLGQIVRGIFAGAIRIPLWPARVAAARAVVAKLAAMDARELADIGLTPHDVRDVAAVPLGEDPTRMLAERAREARIRALEQRPAIPPQDRKRPIREWARTGS